MSLDRFLSKKYDEDFYNCAHFACEVWEYLTGEDITNILSCFLKPVSLRGADLGVRRSFRKLIRPKSPCIVLFHSKILPPHVGVYYNRKVIHIQETGVQYMPLQIASLGFNSVRFYSC